MHHLADISAGSQTGTKSDDWASDSSKKSHWFQAIVMEDFFAKK